jgi:hypothetical protein
VTLRKAKLHATASSARSHSPTLSHSPASFTYSLSSKNPVRGSLSAYIGNTGHDLTLGGVHFIARWKACFRSGDGEGIRCTGRLELVEEKTLPGEVRCRRLFNLEDSQGKGQGRSNRAP